MLGRHAQKQAVSERPRLSQDGGAEEASLLAARADLGQTAAALEPEWRRNRGDILNIKTTVERLACDETTAIYMTNF